MNEQDMRSDTGAPPDRPHRELFADRSLSGDGLIRARRRQGRWVFYYKNGQFKAVCDYVDGELVGRWEWRRENGQPLQAGAFGRGVQVGFWQRFHENGQLWDEGEYNDGKKVGEWKVYDKRGARKSRKVHKPAK